MPPHTHTHTHSHSHIRRGRQRREREQWYQALLQGLLTGPTTTTTTTSLVQLILSLPSSSSTTPREVGWALARENFRVVRLFLITRGGSSTTTTGGDWLGEVLGKVLPEPEPEPEPEGSEGSTWTPSDTTTGNTTTTLTTTPLTTTTTTTTTTYSPFPFPPWNWNWRELLTGCPLTPTTTTTTTKRRNTTTLGRVITTPTTTLGTDTTSQSTTTTGRELEDDTTTTTTSPTTSPLLKGRSMGMGKDLIPSSSSNDTLFPLPLPTVGGGEVITTDTSDTTTTTTLKGEFHRIEIKDVHEVDVDDEVEDEEEEEEELEEEDRSSPPTPPLPLTKEEVDYEGYTLPHLLLQRGDLTSFTYLLHLCQSTHPSLLSGMLKTRVRGWTLFHTCAHQNFMEGCRILLHLPLPNGDKLRWRRWFLSQGNDLGLSGGHLGASRGNLEVLSLILDLDMAGGKESPPPSNPPSDEMNSRGEELEDLGEEEGEKGGTSKCIYTPLHVAVIVGRPETLSYLLHPPPPPHLSPHSSKLVYPPGGGWYHPDEPTKDGTGTNSLHLCLAPIPPTLHMDDPLFVGGENRVLRKLLRPLLRMMGEDHEDPFGFFDEEEVVVEEEEGEEERWRGCEPDLTLRNGGGLTPFNLSSSPWERELLGRCGTFQEGRNFVCQGILLVSLLRIVRLSDGRGIPLEVLLHICGFVKGWGYVSPREYKSLLKFGLDTLEKGRVLEGVRRVWGERGMGRDILCLIMQAQKVNTKKMS